MNGPEVPLPEVQRTYLTLEGREGLYYLTNGGCLYLPRYEFTINLDDEDEEDEKEYDNRRYLYQVPSDSILYTEDFCLMYRVRHYPVLMSADLGFGIIDCPRVVKHDLLNGSLTPLCASHFHWGTGEGQLCDLDVELEKRPFLAARLIQRKPDSSGAF